jgi:hexosaminidase
LLADLERPIAITRGETGVTLALGDVPPDPICSVVALDVPGALVVYETPRIEAPVDRFVGRLAVELATRSGGQEIRYTLDGTDPGVESALYEGPIVLTESSELRARSFAGGRARSSVAARRFERVAPAPARALLAPVPGVKVAIHTGSWDALPDFASLAAVETRTVAAPELLDPTAEHYGLSFEGYVRIPESDVWVFALTSDDGARLWIDGELVVDNDGLHSAEERRGASALAAGWHAFRVGYFNKTGGAELCIQWYGYNGQ